MNTICVILSCAVNLEWDLQQLDVKNTFLHGELEEDLVSSHYTWNSSWFLMSENQGKAYTQSNADPTLFIKKTGSKIAILIVYVDDIVVTGRMLGCRPSDTPLEANVHLSSKTGPNRAFVVRLVSQYMHDPYSSYLEVVFRILRYLKYVLEKGILLSSYGHLRVKAFTNASWANSLDDRQPSNLED
ncbi:uncharacterized mitochondrial protein AtMg00810-like [Telopea speciosissima]|uniref:uncharacterized mitochondrial protein AtMg00810-like n=1 Tax=Telopea speciosissima TaxID=54955 RepID=UPI001CC42AA6|nr:uncharacterized mitochondrial protein AtMg00810-like [Telopea speciosissima]